MSDADLFAEARRWLDAIEAPQLARLPAFTPEQARTIYLFRVREGGFYDEIWDAARALLDVPNLLEHPTHHGYLVCRRACAILSLDWHGQFQTRFDGAWWTRRRLPVGVDGVAGLRLLLAEVEQEG